jgi:hypothetical protein
MENICNEKQSALATLRGNVAKAEKMGYFTPSTI